MNVNHEVKIEKEKNMKKYDVIIVGGSAAGVTAGVTVRKYYPDKAILMIKNVKNVPIPCGIPYVFGTLGDSMKNLLPTDAMMEKNRIDVVNGEVTAIHRDEKEVVVGEDHFAYDKLVLATGSNPIKPAMKGSDLNNVYTIIKDAHYLAAMLEQTKVANDFCIIGGGFIGMEMAEELKKLRPQANVTIVEMQDHCLKLVYDDDYCLLAESGISEQGIQLLTNEKVEGIIGTTNVEGVQLASGKVVKADCVVFGIGCTPNTTLAKDSGLVIGPMRGILVDEYMRTNDPNIFACGDCAEKTSFFDGKSSGLRLASIATAEARIVGVNVFKLNRKNMGTIGVFSTFIGKKTYAAAGLTTRDAKNKGYDVVIGNAEAINRHPGGMAGAEMLKVRLIFDNKTMVLIGGQVFGATSGGEVINAIGALIAKKTTAEEIALFQAGTHPALTASPVAYQLVNAAEAALTCVH